MTGLTEKPMVSVFMISYNHEKYIRAAIDSVLSQKVNFDFNIVIGDDCSKDMTVAILKDYKNSFPEKFDLLINDQNIGATPNALRTYKRCTGKYTAILEGDDFWIDENKLQKQVDFLEKNLDCDFCFTNAFSFIEGNENEKNLMVKTVLPEKFNLKYFLENSVVIPNCTKLIRSEALEKIMLPWTDKIFKLDYLITVLQSVDKKIGYLNIISACYRRNLNSVLSTVNEIYAYENSLFLLKNIRNHVPNDIGAFFKRNELWHFQELAFAYLERGKYLKFIQVIPKSIFHKHSSFRHAFSIFRSTFNIITKRYKRSQMHANQT